MSEVKATLSFNGVDFPIENLSVKPPKVKAKAKGLPKIFETEVKMTLNLDALVAMREDAALPDAAPMLVINGEYIGRVLGHAVAKTKDGYEMSLDVVPTMEFRVQQFIADLGDEADQWTLYFAMVDLAQIFAWVSQEK